MNHFTPESEQREYIAKARQQTEELKITNGLCQKVRDQLQYRDDCNCCECRAIREDAKAKRSLDELLKAREQPVITIPQYARD